MSGRNTEFSRNCPRKRKITPCPNTPVPMIKSKGALSAPIHLPTVQITSAMMAEDTMNPMINARVTRRGTVSPPLKQVLFGTVSSDPRKPNGSLSFHSMTNPQDPYLESTAIMPNPYAGYENKKRWIRSCRASALGSIKEALGGVGKTVNYRLGLRKGRSPRSFQKRR
jgi:hypothetical protein